MSGRQMVRKALILLLAFSVHGCTWFNRDKVSVVHYDSSCLWNIKTGREYAAAGRYELAKEHFLLALASADSAEIRTVLEHELQAVDLKIQTLR